MKGCRTARRAPESNTFRFLVRDPWGISAINGYRRAARHFGYRTRLDPTCEGTDVCRILTHQEASKLREAAQVLTAAYESDDELSINAAESWLAENGVHWFSQDWKIWDPEQDEGALECLGWKRDVVSHNDRWYEVTLVDLTQPAKRGRSRRRDSTLS